MFIIIWPIEVIISFFNTKRRLGDRIAGTKLAVYEPHSGSPKPKAVPILAAVGIGFAAFTLLLAFLPTPEAKSVKPSGANHAAAAELQRRLQENISASVTFEVQVFDSIDRKPGTYVWVNGKLEKNYLSDNRKGNVLMAGIKSQIDSVFDPTTYRGTLQLRYSGGGSVRIQSTSIGGQMSSRSPNK